MDHQELHIEDESGIAGDGSGPTWSVPEVTGDGQLGPLALRHLGDPLLPALNDLLLAWS